MIPVVLALVGGLATSTLVVRSYRKQQHQARQSFDWFKQSLGDNEGRTGR